MSARQHQRVVAAGVGATGIDDSGHMHIDGVIRSRNRRAVAADVTRRVLQLQRDRDIGTGRDVGAAVCHSEVRRVAGVADIAQVRQCKAPHRAARHQRQHLVRGVADIDGDRDIAADDHRHIGNAHGPNGRWRVVAGVGLRYRQRQGRSRIGRRIPGFVAGKAARDDQLVRRRAAEAGRTFECYGFGIAQDQCQVGAVCHHG